VLDRRRLHTEADHLPDTRALFKDVERRYGLKAGVMKAQVHKRIEGAVRDGEFAWTEPANVTAWGRDINRARSKRLVFVAIRAQVSDRRRSAGQMTCLSPPFDPDRGPSETWL